MNKVVAVGLCFFLWINRNGPLDAASQGEYGRLLLGVVLAIVALGLFFWDAIEESFKDI